jgi:hypothetical protein
VTERDLLEHARELHRVHPVVECHTDIAMDVRRRRGDVPGGYDCGGGAAACAGLMIEDTLAEVAMCPELRIVTSLPDLDEAVRLDQVALVLHFEGLAPLLQEGAPGAIGALRAYHELGLRSVQLTWNGANALADGVSVPEPRRPGRRSRA